MWFPLSLLALSMLVARRSSEKVVASNIPSLGMASLQQTAALPFIGVSLLFAPFYWPNDLSQHFWTLMIVYVIGCATDIYCYFKALSIADVSYVAPLLSLTAVGTIIGSYFVLGQVPSWQGIVGALLIVFGAFCVYYFKESAAAHIRKSNKLAAVLVLAIVIMRAYYANIEVLMLRESNPTSFNFYSSFLSIPLLLLVTVIIVRTNRKGKYANYWQKVRDGASHHRWLLLFIGLTYTVNMLATYAAKLDAPTAGYVTAIKSASVLPMVLIGVLFFNEKIRGYQWLGLGSIVLGLVFMAMN